MRKQGAMPSLAITRPATEGPMSRAALKTELFSETAFSKSSRLVISMTKACRAGMSNARITPPLAARTTISST